MSSTKSDSDTEDVTASGPRPRLCHLRKWASFQGYGFNLHAEKTRNGQSIGKVDPNSPAEAAGLKERDRIIEVNYVNISNENHQQVVKRIRNGLELDGKLSENEVVLLVVDPEADDYYKKKNIVVKSDFKNVLRLETPPEETITENNKLNSTNDSPHVSSHRSSISSHSEQNNHNSINEINNNNVDKLSEHRLNTSQNEKQLTPSITEKLSHHKISPAQTPTLNNKSNGSVSSNKDTHSNKTNNSNNNSFNNNNNPNPFEMSAAEFKNYLKNKPKADPRTVQVDMKQKHQIFQDM